MSQSELNEIPENQEPFFDDICSDFQKHRDESFETVSRGFDCLYKDHQRNERLQGTFYIHRGYLINVRKYSEFGLKKSLGGIARPLDISPEPFLCAISHNNFSTGLP
mgnify:CR=1 FL=1